MTGADGIFLARSIGETFQQTAVSGPILLALGAAVPAGLVSFASPCVVPLVRVGERGGPTAEAALGGLGTLAVAISVFLPGHVRSRSRRANPTD